MTIVAIGVSIRECGMSHIFTYNLLYCKNITKNTGLPTPEVVCTESISLGDMVNGSWSSECGSFHNPGAYARYYTFSISSDTVAKIRLNAVTDPYLYLLDGDEPEGTILWENDNVSEGNQNSRIARLLSPGSYTVEATTWDTGVAGNFSLSVERYDTYNTGVYNDGKSWASGHYLNTEYREGTLSIPGAESLVVTVIGETEENSDFVYVFDSNGHQEKQFSGSIDETFTVNDSLVTARLISDFSVTDNGVSVSVEEAISYDPNHELTLTLLKRYITSGDDSVAGDLLYGMEETLESANFYENLCSTCDSLEQGFYVLEFIYEKFNKFGKYLPDDSIVNVYKTFKEDWDNNASYAGVCGNFYVDVKYEDRFFLWNRVDDAEVKIYAITWYNTATDQYENTSSIDSISYEGVFQTGRGYLFRDISPIGGLPVGIPSGVYLVVVKTSDGREFSKAMFVKSDNTQEMDFFIEQ